MSHKTVDAKTADNRKNEILSLPVYSESLGITGKIDHFKVDEGHLIEKKYQIKTIYRGQYYQLWAQYFCLREMGFVVKRLSFYEISTNKTIPVELPGEKERAELIEHIKRFREYVPQMKIETNPSKCEHCIYCSLCDKIEKENVFQ